MLVVTKTSWSKSSSTLPLTSKYWRQLSNDDVFKLNKVATWSLNDLKLASQRCPTSVISEETLKRLSKLTAIDLDETKISKEDILKDINFILNCATVLSNDTAINHNDIEKDTNNLAIMKYNNLREDEVVLPPNESEHRIKLLNNAMKRYNNYFVVPKKN